MKFCVAKKKIVAAFDEDKPCNTELIACIQKFDYNRLLLEDGNVSLSRIHFQLALYCQLYTDRIE